MAQNLYGASNVCHEKQKVIALRPVTRIITRKEVKMGWAAACKRQQKTTNFGAENPKFKTLLAKK